MLYKTNVRSIHQKFKYAGFIIRIFKLHKKLVILQC